MSTPDARRDRTIIADRPPPAAEHRHARSDGAASLALRALGWVLADPARAQRFLDVTGLTPGGLRAAVAEPATQAAVLDFLAAHEPDLAAAAAALGTDAARLIAARHELAA